jgi:uncharacterized protein YjdB
MARQGGGVSLLTPQTVAESNDLAFVSLPLGFVSNAASATVRNPRNGTSVVNTVVGGGVDPVAVSAESGDILDVEVNSNGGATMRRFSLLVPKSRPPRVVRTNPPRSKRDVALNARIVTFFSEPVASSTLTSTSVRLFSGASEVAGAVQLLVGNAVAAAFIPSAPLQANTTYRLEITNAVRDLDGEALEAGDAIEFTTGESFTGPAASVRISPDSQLYVRVGTTYQLTTTVQDAGGNVLTDEPITWSSSDPDAVTVSPSGLLSALRDGLYRVVATAGGVSKGLLVDVSANPAASVVVSPAGATVAAGGDTIILTATVRDAAGRVIYWSPFVTWTSSAPAVATVAYYGAGTSGPVFATVTGVSQGNVTITAVSGAAIGSATVSVGPARPVASVTVNPGSVTLVPQGIVQLSATLRDASGKLIYSRPIAWTSDNTAVATVDANGLVTGVSLGSAAVTATSEGVSATATVAVATITFASVSAGTGHSCGLTATGTAYCWGSNRSGELGNGSTSSSSVPVPVIGGLTFSAVSAGMSHTCALTTSGAAYCWGYNTFGQLGDGSGIDRLAPVAVTGALSFSALTPAGAYTCGLTTSGAAYCWGHNVYGELGNGSTTPSSVPVAVIGGLKFSALSAGGVTYPIGHACGLTTSGTVYCWGFNEWGQLGNGSSGEGAFSSAPVAVSGGLTFSAVSAGAVHACGLTPTGAAYCWGSGRRLGNGSSISSTVPVPVTGGLTFSALALGGSHACALTSSEAVHCWGDNDSGQLGDGSTTTALAPVAVTAGLTFSAVSAGLRHTCGLSTGGVAYCWGDNSAGQLGNASTTSSSVPLKVAGQP